MIAIFDFRHPTSAAVQFVCASALVLVLLHGRCLAQADGQSAPPVVNPEPPIAPGPFAAGVLTTIPADMRPEETVLTHDLVELRSDPALNWNPELLAASRTLFGMSQDVKFRRDVLCLEFSFKPLRLIYVDVPQPGGKLQRKLIWYLVYRVRNTGLELKPVEKEGQAYAAELGPAGPYRFIPKFILESQDRQENGERIDKAYMDRIIPVAVEAIRRREMRGQPLSNSVEIAERVIPPSDAQYDRSVWGVATWQDVDPRIDFLSIYVTGLSNAYNWEDAPAAAKPGMLAGEGRSFVRKTLQLNFWRPGDEMLQDEREIRYGVPVGKSALYDVEDGVAYRWVYR